MLLCPAAHIVDTFHVSGHTLLRPQPSLSRAVIGSILTGDKAPTPESKLTTESKLIGMLTGRHGPVIFNNAVQEFLIKGIK